MDSVPAAVDHSLESVAFFMGKRFDARCVMSDADAPVSTRAFSVFVFVLRLVALYLPLWYSMVTNNIGDKCFIFRFFSFSLVLLDTLVGLYKSDNKYACSICLSRLRVVNFLSLVALVFLDLE